MTITPLVNWLASRTRKDSVTTIVLHATDGASAGSSIAWLKKIGLSYHYVIERDGNITKCVPIRRVAFHAGKSFGPSGTNVNRYSVGISFANRESRKEPITQAQVKACKDLVQAVCLMDSDIKYLTTHYSISPGRKTDPKMLFQADTYAIAQSGKLWIWPQRD